MPIKSNDILKLLTAKHSKAICVSECKIGPTWGATRSSRMDLWVMEKSWANPRVIAYEIKVSRQDFLNDNKWQAYLDYCNELYFVCPPGIINKEELPDGVGLLHTSVNCKKLYTKQKSPYRDVEIPESIFRYILYTRTAITGEYVNRTKKEYWENWLKEKEINSDFGRRVSKKISQRVFDEILNVKSDNDDIKRENERLSEIKEFLEKTNTRYHDWIWYPEKTLKKLNSGLQAPIKEIVQNSITDLTKLLTTIEEMEK